MTLFGEEKGLLGAYYYAEHPLFPLSRTVAAVNLEQMGRTDDNDGAKIRTMSFTGPSYSDLPDRMAEAAKAADVTVYKRSDADAFFARSDNYAFALAGVVAHTLVVAYEYPDYHAVGDEWQKLDYANMAAVDRAVAAGIIRLADDPVPPKWSDIADTVPYRPKSEKLPSSPNP
jgi:Zn-dependent M28 family amino/carboxypeptidase